MKRIRQVNPEVGIEELANVTDVIRSGWLTEGKFTSQLIELSSEIVGSKNILPAPNGTLGLLLAILALDLPKGKKIIAPSFTFYASAMSVIFAGLEPVFADVDPSTYCINVEHIEKLIDDDTVAIMPVHVYGTSADMMNVNQIAQKYNLKVIEDAAQSFGVKYCGEHTGILGDIGVFSFFADKTITMGEGALVVSKNGETHERLKLIRNQGRPHSGTFIHPELGMNFRITDVQAAIGVSQIGKLNLIIEQKRQKYIQFTEILSGIGDIKVHTPTEGSEYIPFRFAFTSKYKGQIDQILDEKGVDTRSFFYPMHMQPKLRKYSHGIELSVSEKLYSEGVCLPIHAGLSEQDIYLICDAIKTVFRR